MPSGFRLPPSAFRLPAVVTGLDRLLGALDGTRPDEALAGLAQRLRDARVGFVTNHSAVTWDLRSGVDALAAAGIRLAALFGPEHGVRGEVAAGRKVESAVDPRTGVPVFSLYGATHEPTPEMLERVEVMLFDIQDVGSRFYTYESTLSHVMRACGAARIMVVVLDRPNPLGGMQTEGPVLEPAQASFVGLHPIPIRHGLTMGELAGLFHRVFGVGAAVEVVPMQGWRRAMAWEETGLAWVTPSPNMPTPDTARVYPGTCLVEGTVLSEGRGTTRPFEWIGAPWIEPDRWAERLNALALPGTRFRPLHFVPTASKHAGEACAGVQVHVGDRTAFAAVATGVALLLTLRELWPDRPLWRESGGRFFVDRLAGTTALRAAIDAGADLDDVRRAWEPGLQAYARQAEGIRLYEE
jgi:uncharacterized protein YbbC (DUF1343 family)